LPDFCHPQRVAISTRGSSGIRSYSCPLGRHMYCFRTLACRLGRLVEMRLFVRHLEPAGLPNQAQPVNDMGIRDERSRSVPEDHGQAMLAGLRIGQLLVDALGDNALPPVLRL